jgi:tetratricopeptide (TPR) repeat protein
LQKGHGTEQLVAGGSQFLVTHLGDQLESFQDTAAVLRNLDLLISVDTAVAHCAGALGVPAWVLLRYAGDWRWLTDRDDSPWYPTMRLFRQTAPRDWPGVFERVLHALQEKLGMVPGPLAAIAPAAPEPVQQAREYQQSGDLERAERAWQQAVAASAEDADAWFHFGETLLGRGRFADAADAYQRALMLSPDHAVALNSLGIALAQQGQWERATSSFRAATQKQVDYPEAYNNLGFALAHQGRLTESESCYQQALHLRPQYSDVLNNLGLLQRSLGKLPEAISYHRQARALQPDFAVAAENLRLAVAAQGQLHNDLAGFRMGNWYLSDDAEAFNEFGLSLQGSGRISDAIACFQEALRLRPDFPEALNNLAIQFRERGNTTEALAAVQRALSLRPDFSEARNSLGTVLESQGRFKEAIACYEQVLQARPDFAEAWNNLGVVQQTLGQYAAALEQYQRAVALKPKYFAARVNMGNTLMALGRLDEAIGCYESVLEMRPDEVEAHLGRAQAWLRQGNFEAGWPEYEWRWRRRVFPPRRFPQPLWDGSPLAGRTILLHAEQGLGDTLQFIRYAPLVRAQGGRVIVECQDALLPLLSSCAGIDQLVAKGTPMPAFDTHAPLLSLPRLLGTTLATIPAQVPYLFADPGQVQRWGSEMASHARMKVGLAWQGNPGNTNDRHRSLPLARFKQLLQREGVQFFGLQYGPGVEQLTAASEQYPLIDLGSRFGTFQDTAAVLANLHLMITVDSAVAHCAGAMGLPVWVLLPFDCDWRWLTRREDSPWYPTMRLFRQTEPGNWESVLEHLLQALDEET